MKAKPTDKIHDIHSLIGSSQRYIQEEYERIQRRATEDPGTAGDQAEENWAELLRIWLPSYFHVVTKGRILTESNQPSPQIDVLVLSPSYPKILLNKKHYLAGGVVAAFECKTTLKAKHINEAVKTSAEIRRALRKREGSPYKELNSPIIYGLLAHSHSWKEENSTPLQNIEAALWDADLKWVQHPRELLDFLCVADLALWKDWKMNYQVPTDFKEPHMAVLYSGRANSGYVCSAIGGDRQESYFSPLGAMLSGLYSKLAWTFPEMRSMDEYFRRVKLGGAGHGKSRAWDISVYSDKTKPGILKGGLRNGGDFDEWQLGFF